MRPPSTRACAAAAGLGLALAIAGCGAGPDLFPDYRPEDHPPIRATLLNEPFELAPGASAAFDLPSGLAGDVAATIDWTHASNTVIAAFGSRSCPGVNHALAGSCNQGLLFAEASTCPAKPRVLTAQVVGSAPVRLYLANAGTSGESGRVQVTPCQDAPDCGAGGACGQCSVERERVESCP
jgi:hypothetical protein